MQVISTECHDFYNFLQLNISIQDANGVAQITGPWLNKTEGNKKDVQYNT
jgi:hypothetical protein